MCTQKESTNKRSNLFINICFGVVTLCIIGLTIIAGYILVSNHRAQIISNSSFQDVSTTYSTVSKEIESKNAISLNSDTLGMTAINDDDHRIINTEFNLSESSGLLDSIINNLTLAVNAVNNVLTSGSILIAILTLFIALVGIFAYHDLKADVRKELAIANGKIRKTECSIENFEKQFNTFTSNFTNQFESIMEHFKLLKSSTSAQERYFNKSIQYLYTVSSILLEKEGLIEEKSNYDLLNYFYRNINIIALYHNELNDRDCEPSAIIQEKIEAIENLKDIGTLDDIPDLEIVAQNEPNNEIKRKIYELIGIIMHNKKNKS